MGNTSVFVKRLVLGGGVTIYIYISVVKPVYAGDTVLKLFFTLLVWGHCGQSVAC